MIPIVIPRSELFHVDHSIGPGDRLGFAISQHLLHPHEVPHPIDPVAEPGSIGGFVKLLFQSGVVIRLAGRVHQGFRDRVALAEGVVQEKVCCIDLARFISFTSGRGLNSLL